MREKQFSQQEYKILRPNEMFSPPWSIDNNPLLDFMSNIDSLCIFYRNPDEIQLIVFC